MRASLFLLAILGPWGCSSDDPGSKGRPGTGTPTGSTPSGTAPGTPSGTATASTDPVCGLLRNPDAELGTADWTVETGELLALGAAANTPVPWEGAAQFAMGQAAFSVAAQAVDLDDLSGGIALGTAVAHLQAQVRDWAGDDEVWLGLTAVDADGTPLAEVLEGPFTDSAWRLRRVHLPLPVDTAAVEVRIGGSRVAGSDNDAYVDALSLCVDHELEPRLPPPSAGPWLTWVEPDAVSVLWETPAPVQGAVEFGRADGDWEAIADEPAATDHHELRITGLDPDTTYRYRLRFGDEVGETYSFRTSPDIAVPFRFTVWGDNQDGPDVFAEIVDRMEVLDPDFALAVGDVVQTGTENNWRNELLDPILDLTLDTPFLVAAGNHERLLDGDGSNFDLHLAQPGDEHCFGWTYAGAFFLVIDTEEPVDSGPQAQCIADQLASPEFAAADVQIAAFHYPPRIEYWAFWTFDGQPLYTGDPDVRHVLEPQFSAAGVDLVLNGHNHLYAYTPAGAYSTVTWVTTGGGGGSIDTSGWVVGTWDGIETTVFDYHFLHIAVDGREIAVSAVGLDGQVLHDFVVSGD